MSSNAARRTDAGTREALTAPAPLAPVIPLRTAFDPRASRVHVHDWTVVADENDGFGRVRELACTGCHAVRYA
jgi:hypothetical protein